ncbi:MAG: hypothetical protein ACI9R3_003881 [Verrucomicrobiales bacterium]
MKISLTGQLIGPVWREITTAAKPCPLQRKMTEAQTYSWIFYATSAAANAEMGVKLRDIEAVADGINHAFPTQKEMAAALSWAESKGLIKRLGKKVILTADGKKFAAQFFEKPGGVMKTWERITTAFEIMGVDNTTSLDCRTMKAEQ